MSEQPRAEGKDRNLMESAVFVRAAVSRAFEADADNTDRVLVNAAQQGDSSAFTALVDRYYSSVYGIIYRMCGGQDAEDLTQEVFVRALRALRQFEFRGVASFKTWLYRIAVNIAINELRKRGRRGQVDTTSLEQLQELSLIHI